MAAVQGFWVTGLKIEIDRFLARVIVILFEFLARFICGLFGFRITHLGAEKLVASDDRNAVGKPMIGPHNTEHSYLNKLPAEHGNES